MNAWRELKRTLIWASLFFLFFTSDCRSGNTMTAYHGDLTFAPTPNWPPKGYALKCPVIRDNWISSVGDEIFGNNGGSKRLKVKGQQEYILLDIDPSKLKGKLISGALLHLRSASPRKAPLARIGVSSVASRWVEGTSTWYRPQPGSSCFSQAEYKNRNWAYPGSTLLDVIFGKGHTIWKFAECSQPNQEGWQSCAVDPDVVAARIAGLSHGFCLFDEVGSIWSIKKGKFQYTYFPNRFCFSRESDRSGPWLQVWVTGTDSIPPDPIKALRTENEGLPAGEALVRWVTPPDAGGGKILGFLIDYIREGRTFTVPRYLIPMARKSGEEVKMHLQDLHFKPGESVLVSIRPVDSAGNIGQPFTETIQLSSGSSLPDIPDSGIRSFLPNKALPVLAGLKVSVVDLLDKIDPKSGEMIPALRPGYKGGNHLFSAKEKKVRLQAARNETVCFQINIEGTAQNISVRYTFDDNPNFKPRLYQFAHVNVTDSKGKTESVLPDPLIPLTGACSIPSTAGSVQIPDQSNLSLICELFIPHEETPGTKKGKVTISVGQENLDLEVELLVWDFTLPDKLSFIPEMNAYTVVSPYKGYEYYRLAHEHRTCINRLAYGWHGLPEFAPTWDGEDFDWDEWDKKVGPLLDGSAFEEMPRKNEPVDVFYLPFSENWPVNIFDNYRPSYWADEAFVSGYGIELKRAFSAFASHCNEKKWHETIFQFYLNNKVYYRKDFHRSSAPWIFDEPVNTQDFWALRWYGTLWHSAVDQVRGYAKMWFRGDISYSQFGRDILLGVMDVEYLGGNNAQKTRMKHDEQTLWDRSHFAEYGTANKIETPNIQPTLWCLSAWSKGAIGVLPWQTIGGKNCWITAEQTALFYPHPNGPKPSVRLKAFTRGQQDVEYLTLLCDVYGMPRFVVAEWLREFIGLDGSFHRSIESDAGTARFDNGDAVELWKMRCKIGKMLSDMAPEYKRAVVDWSRPRLDMKRLPDIGYVPVAPEVKSYRPVCDSFRP